MGQKTFYRTNPQAAARMLLVGMFVAGILLLAAIAMEQWLPAIVASLWVFFYAWRRVSFGPTGEAPLIVIDPEVIGFDDRAVMGRSEFAVADIRSVHVVGPVRDRRIRVHKRTGEQKDVIRSLGRGRTKKAVLFLRESLPESVPLVEEEPPSWSAAIRGDF